MDGLIRNPLGESELRCAKPMAKRWLSWAAQREDVVVLSADVQSSDFS